MFILASILFRLLIELSYVNIISQRFIYDGFVLDFNYTQYLFSWILYFISFLSVNKTLGRLSDMFFLTAHLSVITPLLVLYGLDDSRDSLVATLFVVTFLIMKILVEKPRISGARLKTLKEGKSMAIGVSVFFVIGLISWVFITNVKLNFNFLNVYEYRSENSSVLSGGILSYTNNWTYQVFNIFLFSFFLAKKKYIFAFFCFLAQVVFFASFAHKSILFFPFLVLMVWFFFRGDKNKSLTIFPLAFSLVITLTVTSYYLTGEVISSSMFSRRLFFVPANLSFAYFEFFFNNQFVLWSNSVFEFFLEYPYSKRVPHVIGDYLGYNDVGANTGFIASAFGHAGFLGIVAYGLIIICFLRFLNFATKGYIPLWFAVALFIVPFRSMLISSDLLTVFLTHGFLVAVILVILFRRGRKS